MHEFFYGSTFCLFSYFHFFKDQQRSPRKTSQQQRSLRKTSQQQSLLSKFLQVLHPRVSYYYLATKAVCEKHIVLKTDFVFFFAVTPLYIGASLGVITLAVALVLLIYFTQQKGKISTHPGMNDTEGPIFVPSASLVQSTV